MGCYSIIGIVIYVRISFNGLTSGIVNWIQEYILSAKHSIPQQKEVIFFFFNFKKLEPSFNLARSELFF